MTRASMRSSPPARRSPDQPVSISRKDLLTDHDVQVRPDFAALVECGIRPKDLRAHSDLMWNEAVNDLVAGTSPGRISRSRRSRRTSHPRDWRRHVERRWSEVERIRL
jgi:hypothetical protein